MTGVLAPENADPIHLPFPPVGGINTPCLKNMCHLYFYDNFGKRGPISIIFSLLNSERICRKRRN